MICPLCDSDLLNTRRGHNNCPKCRTEVLSLSDAASAYPDSYYGSTTAKFSGAAGRARRFWHAGRARRLRQRFAATASPIVYDIGCGDGEFLAACLDNGFDVRGCEPVDRPRRQAEQRLGCTLDVDAFSVNESGRYDVITAWQVIEHMPLPAEFLRAAYDNLVPNGILAVSTVNIDSLQAALFGSYWLHLDPPRHLWVGSRPAVESLVDRCGFDIIDRIWNHLEFGPIGYVDSAINLVDSRRDRLLHCLKNGFHGVTNKALWLVAAALTPVGIMLSAAESAAGRSATFELYARRRSSDDGAPTPERPTDGTHR